MDWRISSPTSGLAEAMLLVQSPKLRRIEIDAREYADASSEAFEVFLQAIVPVLTRIDALILSGHSGGHNSIATVCNLKQLHTLEIKHPMALTQSILDSLLELPLLNTLSLEIGDVETDSQDRAHVFLSLKTLSLTGRLYQLDVVLSSLTLPKLTRILLTAMEVSHYGSDVRTLISRLYDFLPWSLDALNLTLKASKINYHHTHRCSALEFLQPLHARHLRELTFHFHNVTVIIMDQHVRAVEQAWPDLTTFQFTQNEEVTHWMVQSRDFRSSLSASPTVQTVVAFAAARPHLERLSIPCMSLQCLPPLNEVPMNHGLRWLDVPIIDSDTPLYPVALTLDRMFPNVGIPEDTKTIGRSTGLRGEELKLLMLGLQAGRRGKHFEA